MVPSLAQATEDFEQHLNQNDWTGQSPARRRILDAFLGLALEHGVNSVSMRMIAQALNIKAPSLYAHFANGREEIVAESLRWHFHKFGMAILEELATCTSADQAWTAMVRVHLSRQLELPESNLWDLIIATDRMVHNLPAEMSAEAEELVGLYDGLFRAAAHEMGVNEPHEAVRLVMTLLEGASRWCDWSDDQDQQQLLVERADQLSRLMLQQAADWTATSTKSTRSAALGPTGTG
jgi:AcrR family transcriptional regulator